MTRTRAASTQFVDGLSRDLRQRVRPIFAPLLQIAGRDDMPALAPDDAVIFTSANGVKHAPPGQGRVAFCVGPATTAEASARGWNAQQAGENADGLVAHLTRLCPQQRLFHLSGAHTRGHIADRLAKVGLTVSHHVTYDQHLLDLTPEAAAILTGNSSVIVPLFSPRTAAHLAAIAPTLSRATIVALSTAVADALRPHDFADLLIAQSPDADAMQVAIRVALDRVEGGRAAE